MKSFPINAPTAAGPTPDYPPNFGEFQRLSGLFRDLQKAGLLKISIVDGEVQALGQPFGIGDPPGDQALCGDFLIVLGAAPEQEGHVAVVHRDLRDAGAVGTEPEGQAPARLALAALAVVSDVDAGFAAQVAQESVAADLGHISTLLVAVRAGRLRLLKAVELGRPVGDTAFPLAGRLQDAFVQHAASEGGLVHPTI